MKPYLPGELLKRNYAILRDEYRALYGLWLTATEPAIKAELQRQKDILAEQMINAFLGENNGHNISGTKQQD